MQDPLLYFHRMTINECNRKFIYDTNKTSRNPSPEYIGRPAILPQAQLVKRFIIAVVNQQTLPN
ncbi:hypothetical protein CW304_01055 [Bacillus sp. UFRGS-B20]|nr:hypothetical protein CW304_01055 [Bacillus sp. UFRGS-B20]